jgi:hypothetical protein
MPGNVKERGCGRVGSTAVVDSQDRCPMAFEELGDLQQADWELSNIIGSLEKGQACARTHTHTHKQKMLQND